MGDSQVMILIRETLLFAAMSAFLLLVDIALLWVRLQYFSWPYLLAATVSFSAGVLVGYFLSVTTAFKYRRLRADSDFSFPAAQPHSSQIWART